MRVVSSQSIILKHQDFKERDRLVTFLARDKGRMAGIARGARNPKNRGIGAYEPFTRGVIHYVESPGSDLVSIRKCDPEPPYLYLQGDYHKFLFAGYMTELIHLCPIQPGEAEPYFLLLSGALKQLTEEKSPRAFHLLRLDYELDFLETLGVQPDWSHCAICNRPFGGGAPPMAGPAEGNPAEAMAEKAPPSAVPLGAPRSPEPPGAPRSPEPLGAPRSPVQFDTALGGLRCGGCRRSGVNMPELSLGSLAFLLAWRGTLPGKSPHPPGLVPTRANLEQLENAVTRHLIHQIEREPRSLALLPEPDLSVG